SELPETIRDLGSHRAELGVCQAGVALNHRDTVRILRRRIVEYHRQVQHQGLLRGGGTEDRRPGAWPIGALAQGRRPRGRGLHILPKASSTRSTVASL